MMNFLPRKRSMPMLKSSREIEIMDKANDYVQRVLEHLSGIVHPGMTTMDLEKEADNFCTREGVTPAFKGYSGYPACLCVSINDEIVHGIPSADRYLAKGDIVSIDFGVKYEGYFGDAALTVAVGDISTEARSLMDATLKSLKNAVAQCRPGNTLGDIGWAVQSTVEPLNYSVVRDFVGHGIGLALHETPQVPNYGTPGHGMPLSEGLVIAIEPMVCAGGHHVKVDADGWTARTKDGRLAAHYEYSVAITSDGPRVLGDPVY